MRIIVLDTETTGTEPEVDRLVELAGVSIDIDGPQLVKGESNVVWTFEALCNPGRDIPFQAMAVHHITPEMVATEPTPDEIVGEFLAEVGEVDFWCAHNAPFDRGFLSKFSPYFDEFHGVAWIDTYRCALHLWPDAPSYSNQVLRYWRGVKPALPRSLAPHRALYDAIVTAELLKDMLQTHTPRELVELQVKPALQTICRFGKHRGTAWKDVPRDYMTWCLKQSDMDPDVRHTCLHWLEGQTSML